MTATSTLNTNNLVSLSGSKQARLQKLFGSRLGFALAALIVQALIMIPLMRSFLFIVGLFNLPAIIGLIACTIESKLFSCEAQKLTKTFLKVGIAKAIGGVLLAIYMGLKFVCMIHQAESSTKATIRVCVIYLTASAVVDILYCLFAVSAIKKTREIVKILKRQRAVAARRRAVYVKRSSMEDLSSGSTSCSEEETCERGSQASI